MDENRQKYENYKEQFKRLKKALNNGFNLEAIFIEYAIIEDRSESILVHAEKWDAYLRHRRGHQPTIDSKLRYIQKLAENKEDMLHRYFKDDLIERILTWKEERNRLIHALLNQDLQQNEIFDNAVEGEELAKNIRNRANSYKRAIEKKHEQERTEI